jgi:hypothetical protein
MLVTVVAKRFFTCPNGTTDRKTIIGLGMKELENEMTSHELPTYRARQLWNAIYHKGVETFDSITTLPIYLRNYLDGHYVIRRGSIKVGMGYHYYVDSRKNHI